MSSRRKTRSKTRSNKPTSTVGETSATDFVRRAYTHEFTESLRAEHEALKQRDWTVLSFAKNKERNRYENVALLDKTRVELESTAKGDTDYIHASHLRCFGAAFVLAQAPMETTVVEYWRMVWQTKAQVLVNLVRMEDSDCYQYWPARASKSLHFGAGRRFKVLTRAKAQRSNSLSVYELTVKCKDRDAGAARPVSLVHFAWPPKGRHPDADQVLEVVEAMRGVPDSDKAPGSDKAPDSDKAPVIVNCDGGVLRSGTFAAIALVCQQMRAEGTVAVEQSVVAVQSARYGALRYRNDFKFVHLCALEYGVKLGLLSAYDPKYIECVDVIRRAIAPRID